MGRSISALDVLALERARIAKGLLLSEVGKAAGISAASTRRAFRRGLAGMRVARAIARVLEVDLREIVLPRLPR
jgi:lambda repressor-like predicted transcriptional regulator